MKARRLPLLIILFRCLVAFGSPTGSGPGEYEIKAAFLVNFTHFVEWPADEPEETFSVCIVGPDPFQKTLEEVIGQRTANGKAITVRRLKAGSELSGCKIAFLSEQDKAALAKTLIALEHSHTLTVGESAGFAEHGGMIGFRLENQRVCLELNTQRASLAGLKISSQLVRVAKPAKDEKVGGAGQ